MPIHENSESAQIQLSMLTAADLQDHLLSASNDLDRLQTLLSDACSSLLQGFYGISDDIEQLRALGNDCERIQGHLGRTITALQFQDMASQLIDHTQRRLRSCNDRLARDAFADDDEEALVEEAPLRPNPVTQAEMDAGSVELF